MQKMNIIEMIILTRELNIENTLTIYKNIVKIRKFKRLIIFKIIFKESKKILKFNNFYIKDVVLTTVLRRERFKIIIHKIKIKNMFQNIKNEKVKMMKKINKIMHLKLQMKNIK